MESNLLAAQPLQVSSTKLTIVVFSLLKRPQSRNEPLISDIDLHFNSPQVNMNDLKNLK